MRDGANAVDAAVVAAAVLGVTEPFSCGIGGGGFMVDHRASDRKVTTIDHRETAPAAMRPNSFFENGVPLPFNDARYSGLSAGVPGTVRGWEEALERFGTMSLGRRCTRRSGRAPAGFVVDETFVDQTQGNVDYFDDVTSTRELYLDPDGTPRDVGTMLRNPDLARTYARSRTSAPRASTAARSPTRWSRRCGARRSAPEANHVWRARLMTMRDLQGLHGA